MSDKGILLHITSLPSPYGIGTFGRCAYKFADRLAEKGYKYWQILPLCPTGFRDSPYQSFSSFAGNPYLIDLDMLCKKRLLRHSEIDSINWGKDPSHVDFGTIYEKRFPLLLRMSSRFDFSDPLYIDFCESNREWLDDYAVFMAMKKFVGGEPWYNWDRRVRFRDPSYMHKLMGVFSSEIRFWKMIQYLFYEQWYELKAHVNSLGIQIIGDMPLYVALDSADVWSRPEKFLLNDQLEPTALAGCPPDSFSKDGQMWGNPIYDWPHMKDHEYEWWIERLRYISSLYDITRIDHFRGFDSYYSIDAAAATAAQGHWEKGPGLTFFRHVESKLGNLSLIAEDLGFMSDSVRQLVKDTGFPGMKVFEFAFDEPDSTYLPEHYDKNCFAYIGTHDNDTLKGWLSSLDEQTLVKVKKYVHLEKDEILSEKIMSVMADSDAKAVIFQMQDILGLGTESRMNIPSTVKDNWTWRMTEKDLSF